MRRMQRTIVVLITVSVVITVCLYSSLINFHERLIRLPTTEVKLQTSVHGSEDASSVRYLTAKLIGGLGNQMFVYSTLYALSRQSGRVPHVCGSYNMSDLFPNLTIPVHPLSHCDKGSKLLPQQTLSLRQAENSHYFDPGLLQRIQNSNVTRIHICCHFINLCFFHQYFKDLRKEFSLSYSHREIAHGYLNEQVVEHRRRNPGLDDINIQIVGVHVRRGDILNTPGIIPTPPSYFKNAMDYFRKKYKARVLFIVSSDDPDWCREFLNSSDTVLTADSGAKSREEDFSIQVCCHHTIISMGTFGWWMGFLTEGKVIAYTGWVGTSKAKRWFFPGQRYPVNWKLM